MAWAISCLVFITQRVVIMQDRLPDRLPCQHDHLEVRVVTVLRGVRSTAVAGSMTGMRSK
jgi:hypothetical protein